jgi:integrase/recombinase XerC
MRNHWEEFIDYLRYEKRYSPHTILSYENDLKQYYGFAAEAGISEEFPDSRTIRLWIVTQMEVHVSTRTIHRKLSSLRSYCKYLMQKGNMDSNPLDKVLKPKLSKRLPEFIEDESINQFLNEYDFGNDFEGIRNRLIIELLYQTGMRRAEIINLKLSSFDPDRKQLLVKGKRDKERIIPVSVSLGNLIEKYLQERQQIVQEVSNSYLLLTTRGAKVYDKLIYRVVNHFLGFLTTQKKKSPHVLRHTFATHLLNKGADLNAIKELLGHANLSATQVYTHNSFENLKNAYKQAHPRAD